ncbi:MAG: FAD-dependent oxidoreductase [Solirubrobacteraceae bacterium]|nr:FAD-dependent oxidoreductase [Solirubrobacteraceae bacterium]
MPKPVLLAVDEDPESLAVIERELSDRYANSYRILIAGSAASATAKLQELAGAGEDVALVLASLDVCDMTGGEFLATVRLLYPQAQRGLVIEWRSWGDTATGEAIFKAMAHRQVEYYVIRPTTSPDELFHQAVSTFLLEWATARRVAPHTVHVVGESWSGRAFELRHILDGCAVPHAFVLADTDEGKALIAGAGEEEAPLPLVVFPNGQAMANPENLDLAKAVGATVDPEHSDFDLVIVGCGPAGLSAAVYGASEGLRTLVVDQGGIGGQATSSSLIRNYLGFPRGLSGQVLAQRAFEQAWVFGAKFALMHDATGIRREGDELCVALSSDVEVRARAVVVASGATYRRIGNDALEGFVGAGVFYGGTGSEAPGMLGADVFVLGGANSAGQAAMHLADYARSVTIVIRADSIAKGMSHYLVEQIEGHPRITVRTSCEAVDAAGTGRLQQLVLRDRTTGEDETVDADAAFVMIGALPNTDWLPADLARNSGGFLRTGLDLELGDGWPLQRQPLALETSMPGVFAAGDVRHGSPNRVASAVGEGSIAIRQVHELLAIEQARAAGTAAAG